MMLNLTDRDWREFVIGDLFDISIGQAINGNKVDRNSGKTAYITRKESNNGLDGFINHSPKMLNVVCPVITIGNETAEPFVQVFSFFTGTKVNILAPKTSLSANALLFIAQSLKMHKAKYSYSFTINSTRLRKQLILLPATVDGEPDYVFMEKYVREREAALLTKYKRCILEKYMLSAVNMSLPLDNLDWQEFFVTDYFDISTGTENNMAALKSGITPLVSAKKTDNGLKAFVKGEQVKAGNVVTWNKDGDGGAGLAYYQPFEFAADSHILVLTPKSNLSSYTCIFITRALSQYYGIFGHGRANSVQRANKTKILLPATAKGIPDWDYMESYVKIQQARQICAYLDYLEKRL